MTDQTSRTPRTAVVLASQPNGGFGLDKAQCIAQWCDLARTLELEAADLRERLAKAREEAIEECAMVAEQASYPNEISRDRCIQDIRALKQKGADHE